MLVIIYLEESGGDEEDVRNILTVFVSNITYSLDKNRTELFLSVTIISTNIIKVSSNKTYKIKSLHGPVNFIHDVVGLAL